jgi:hypothetical protein
VNAATFERMWLNTRHRVLTRLAQQATEDAQRMRAQIPAFPEHADELEQVAAGLDDYATRCTAAAADPTLPTPAYAGSAAAQD